MRTKFLVFGSIVFGACLAPAYAQFGTEPAQLSTIKVRDDIYVISNVEVPGLVTALITNDGVLLVDDKFDVDHDTIMRQLRTVTNQPVKYVINTHYHADHSGGNAKLQALNAVVFASEAALTSMIAANQPGQPNVTTDGPMTIYIGGKVVEIHPVARAHTNGDVVVLFPEQRVLAAGDIFANGAGTSAQLPDYPGGGSVKSWPQAVEQSLRLQFDTVIPGHGLVSTRADYQAYLERAKRFSATLGELVRQGKSRADIEKVVRAEYDWEDFHIDNALDGLIAEFR